MLDLWFGLDASGFDRSSKGTFFYVIITDGPHLAKFHPVFGPILMVTYACLSNTLLLTGRSWGFTLPPFWQDHVAPVLVSVYAFYLHVTSDVWSRWCRYCHTHSPQSTKTLQRRSLLHYHVHKGDTDPVTGYVSESGVNHWRVGYSLSTHEETSSDKRIQQCQSRSSVLVSITSKPRRIAYYASCKPYPLAPLVP